jgi:hypothetical protein
LSAANVSFSPGACSPGDTVTATITYSMPAMTGFFGPTVAVSGQGAMRCGG